MYVILVFFDDLVLINGNYDLRQYNEMKRIHFFFFFENSIYAFLLLDRQVYVKFRITIRNNLEY